MISASTISKKFDKLVYAPILQPIKLKKIGLIPSSRRDESASMQNKPNVTRSIHESQGPLLPVVGLLHQLVNPLIFHAFS
jgi:hypothetical protein